MKAMMTCIFWRLCESMGKTPLYYNFCLHLDYAPLPLPRKGGALSVRLFWDTGYRDEQLQSLNRCQIALKMLFLLDITTAYGRLFNTSLVLKPNQQHKGGGSIKICLPQQTAIKLRLEIMARTLVGIFRSGLGFIYSFRRLGKSNSPTLGMVL
jgi:hypothetical protein